MLFRHGFRYQFQGCEFLNPLFVYTTCYSTFADIPTYYSFSGFVSTAISLISLAISSLFPPPTRPNHLINLFSQFPGHVRNPRKLHPTYFLSDPFTPHLRVNHIDFMSYSCFLFLWTHTADGCTRRLKASSKTSPEAIWYPNERCFPLFLYKPRSLVQSYFRVNPLPLGPVSGTCFLSCSGQSVRSYWHGQEDRRHRYRSSFDRRLFDHRLLEKITSAFFQPLTCVGVLSLNRYRSQRTKRARCFKNEKKTRISHTRHIHIRTIMAV